eukprot:Tamp_09601.p1 GENE.Tamp_09601~~Tamp_09601.p1  ORF type:complete len:384 (-),score=76.18 Tamp_09601:385-1536(-)
MHGRGTFTTAAWIYTGSLAHDRPTEGELTEAGGRRFRVEYPADCALMNNCPIPKTKTPVDPPAAPGSGHGGLPPGYSGTVPGLVGAAVDGIAALTIQPERRGTCRVCGEGVYSTQARGRMVDGSYFHQQCAQAGVGPQASSAAAASSSEQQQLLSRLADVEAEPLTFLSPVTGIGATPRQSVMQAALATGVPYMDAHGFAASEFGADRARNDPHGLDTDEAGALNLYTHESELFGRLNALLRQRDRSRLKPFFPYLKLVLDARHKLPRYEGTVWRGVKGVNLLSKYPKGKEVYWWAFSSTTKELSTLQNPQFLGQTGLRTVFCIQVKGAVDIVPYSIFQGSDSEAEVLLFPGTKLRVVDSIEMGSGLCMIHLEEIQLPTEMMQ